MREAKAEAVAICFLHAHINAVHEARAKDVLQRLLPGVWITTSAEVVPEFREYERFSTTVINAYLLPVMDRYMSSLSAKLGEAGYRGKVFTMSSGGGIMDLDAARSMPVRTILSGPAGGVAGALWIAKAADLRDFITCDMGGTSTDVCLIENLQAASVSETAFAGYPIKGREVAINTVGAGGGSIAYMEAGRTLQVGPRSAGAEPGPACYGRGGIEPTVTDANVVLGRLGPRLLGGVIRPDLERAQRCRAARWPIGWASPASKRWPKASCASPSPRWPTRFARSRSSAATIRPNSCCFPSAAPAPCTRRRSPKRSAWARSWCRSCRAICRRSGLLASDQRYERVQTFMTRLSTLDRALFDAAIDEHVRVERDELQQRGFARRCRCASSMRSTCAMSARRSS